MDNQKGRVTPEAGLGERLLREVLKSPPLKELLMLYARSIDPQKAPGLARALLWEDPVLFMSVVGALPDAADWTVEFLLELGRQLDTLPGPLLRDFVAMAKESVDGGSLAQIPPVYGRLMRKLLVEEGAAPEQVLAFVVGAANAALAGADELTRALEENLDRLVPSLAGCLQEFDTAAAGRVAKRVSRLAWETVKAGRRAWRPGGGHAFGRGLAFAFAAVAVIRLLSRAGKKRRGSAG